MGFGIEFVATSVLTVTAAATPVATHPATPIVPRKPSPRTTRLLDGSFSKGCPARARFARRAAVASVVSWSTEARLRLTNLRIIERSDALIPVSLHLKEYGFLQTHTQYQPQLMFGCLSTHPGFA